MKRKQEAIIILTTYITMWVTLFVARIGDYTTGGIKIEWYDTICIFLMLAIPSYLGWDIGRHHE